MSRRSAWLLGTSLLGLGTAAILVVVFFPRELTLEDIRSEGELVFLTRNAPTIYYFGQETWEGPEHDLATSFAGYVGVSPRFEVYDSVAEILDAVRAGKGQVAAASLTRTGDREQGFLFGPDYRTVEQELVCHRDGPVPKTLDDLPDVGITVIAASSYEENLNRLKADMPNLNWSTTTDLDTEQLLEMVWDRELDCTIADSNIVAVNRRYYPELKVAFPVSDPEPLAWIVPEHARAVLPKLQEWFARAEAGGLMAEVEERYYGHVDDFDYVDVRTFTKRIDTLLPKFLPHMKKEAEKHDFPWTLLAAVGYQESHWNPKARSPTGVRGLMMLTQRTANEVGVENRLDPVQSIRGSARYLSNLSERIPESVTGEDRIWFTLAAYNIGLGHVYDARKLAVQLGKDPDVWGDLKEVLPLLSQKRHYKKLKHGYARGREPVRYVTRVRDFQDILEQRLEREEKTSEEMTSL